MPGPEGKTFRCEVGGRELSFNTGRYAKQSAGSVWVRYGDNIMVVNANATPDARDLPFLPLTVVYEERLSSGGRIPGSFFRREGKPTERETLLARITDRTIRPLFPEGWRFETQVIAQVFSYDNENDPDQMALNGASAALCISDIPFDGPVAGVRVGRLNGELIANPTMAQRDELDIDIFVGCSKDAIVMVEGGAKEASEADMVKALEFAFQSAQPILATQEEMIREVGREKRPFVGLQIPDEIYEKVFERAKDRLAEAFAVNEKHARYAALDAVKEEVLAAFALEVGADDWDEQHLFYKEALARAKYQWQRQNILKTKRRIGGRGPKDIREIWCEVGVLPRNHGSAVFTRGETQALVSCTLGTERDDQRIETLSGMEFRKFMLHYNFPPYSVGEVRRMGPPGRREIGHGALAHRALEQMVPVDGDDFPYTIRVTSDILESNGSSSMATVCGATLALMDAGVPLRKPVAGIAMGLIMEGDEWVVLSDILGDEDHLGDMDFKICGTRDGITAIQMDIKCPGLTFEIMRQALDQAREGRLFILGEMAKVLDKPRPELSRWAPRIVTIKINEDRIRDVIGPGGKMIRDITARTNTSINIEDDGTISIASANLDDVEAAIKIIRELTQEPEVGKVYTGTVRKIVDFGAFVEILPNTDGLLHISEIADKRVNKVTDYLQEGDEVLVKVLNIDRQGKIRLSRRAALAGGGEENGGEGSEAKGEGAAKAEAGEQGTGA
ncbi:MAG: polyribonucleotide nucleotidyltransferase [Deltaproteobacteria bacterium]|nr:MAG: polyribonucleotide nucleotidyltransferase [Deltaproteobacteria bacterium]